MNRIRCKKADETFDIHQADDGRYCCPVCGAAEFRIPPYYANGHASFEMCSFCEFEFGFDDSPLASDTAIEGIQANWKRWRRKIIERSAATSETLAHLEGQLKNIRIRLVYDLLDVPEENEK